MKGIALWGVFTAAVCAWVWLSWPTNDSWSFLLWGVSIGIGIANVVIRLVLR